jgi:hypothetical protein
MAALNKKLVCRGFLSYLYSNNSDVDELLQSGTHCLVWQNIISIYQFDVISCHGMFRSSNPRATITTFL